MKKTQNKISILLPAYRSEKLLQHVFVRSYNKTAPWHELIVYDNGGNGEYLESLKFLESLKLPGEEAKIKVIGSGKNVGLNAALNECAKVAKGDWFYLPHTDMYLMPGWDTALLDAVKNQPPDKQLLCSRSIEPTKGHTDYHIIKNYGTEWDEFDEKRLLEDFKHYKDWSIIQGLRMPIFLHRKLWEQFEKFNLEHLDRKEGVDTNYFSYAHENDMIINAYHLGVRRFWMVYDSLCYHLQGKSNAQQNVDRDSNKPYDYLRTKWAKFGYSIGHVDTFEQKLFSWYSKVR